MQAQEEPQEDLGACALCGAPLKRCKIDQYGSVLICVSDHCPTHPVYKDEFPLKLVSLDNIIDAVAEVNEDRRGW